MVLEDGVRPVDTSDLKSIGPSVRVGEVTVATIVEVQNRIGAFVSCYRGRRGSSTGPASPLPATDLNGRSGSDLVGSSDLDRSRVAHSVWRDFRVDREPAISTGCDPVNASVKIDDGVLQLQRRIRTKWPTFSSPQTLSTTLIPSSHVSRMTMNTHNTLTDGHVHASRCRCPSKPEPGSPREQISFTSIQLTVKPNNYPDKSRSRPLT